MFPTTGCAAASREQALVAPTPPLTTPLHRSPTPNGSSSRSRASPRQLHSPHHMHNEPSQSGFVSPPFHVVGRSGGTEHASNHHFDSGASSSGSHPTTIATAATACTGVPIAAATASAAVADESDDSDLSEQSDEDAGLVLGPSHEESEGGSADRTRCSSALSGMVSPSKLDALLANPDRISNYILGKTLGEGAFAKVKAAVHSITGSQVAIKIINKSKVKDDYVLKNLHREGELLRRMRHRHIIALYEIIETDKLYCLVTEQATGGEVLDYIVAHGSLPEKEVRKYMRQLVTAVDHMHKAGVVHRDLKAENLLLDQDLHLKLIDFGLGNTLDGEPLHTQCGSPAYTAPEVLGGKPYTEDVDIWSIGINMYAMLTGRLPFSSSNVTTLHALMLDQKYDMPPHLTDGCRDLLSRLLRVRTKERIGMAELLRHPWLSEGLPPLAPEHPPSPLQAAELDQQVLSHMSRLGFPSGPATISVLTNACDAASAVYHMLCAKRRSASVLRTRGIARSHSENQIPRPFVESDSEHREQPLMASLDSRHAVVRPRAGSGTPANPLPPPSSAWASRRNSVGEIRRPDFARTPTARTAQRSPSSRSIRPDSSNGDDTAAAASTGLSPISPVSTVVYHRSRRMSIGEDPTVRRPISEAPSEALFSPPAPLAAAVPIPPPGTSAAAAVFASTRASRPNAAIDRDGTKRVLPSIRRSNTTSGDLSSLASTASHASSGHSHTAAAGTQAAGAEGDIPAMRFPLNKQMVSEKSAESLFGELQRVLARQGMSMVTTSQPLALECATSDGAVRFDAEIVRIPRLNNMHGVHFRRRCGDATLYKTICKQLLELMQL